MAEANDAHLLGIPTELRLQIYGYVVGAPRKVTIAILDAAYIEFKDVKHEEDYEAQWGPSMLLRSCKTIYSEAVPVLYGSTLFEFDVESGKQRLELGETAGIPLASPLPQWTALKLVQGARLNVYGDDIERFDILLGRLESLLSSLDNCRRLKKLDIGLYPRLRPAPHSSHSAKRTWSQIIEALQGIGCQGRVCVLRTCFPEQGDDESEMKDLAVALGVDVTEDEDIEVD